MWDTDPTDLAAATADTLQFDGIGKQKSEGEHNVVDCNNSRAAP